MILEAHAWNKGGYLTADMDQLARLCRAKSASFFRNHCQLVLQNFVLVSEEDGTQIYVNRQMAEEYSITLEKWLKQALAGAKGAEVRYSGSSS